MIIAEDNRSNRRETCPSATLPISSIIRTLLGSNTTLLGSLPVKRTYIFHQQEENHYSEARGKEKIVKNGKGKTIPMQAWTDPEGTRRLRLPNFKTIST
jgi:hypothetical protein